MSTSQEALATANSLFSSICKPVYQKRLQEILNSKQATVFSTTYCPFCVKAKAILDQNDIEYSEVMLDEIYGVD